MTKLKHKLTNDLLFKITFTKYPDLLKRLVSELLSIEYDSIRDFRITSPDLTPEFVGEKFCKLDINMNIDGEQVNLEMQVNDEGNFPERSLYYWAKMYSSSLEAGGKYASLPRTITINILGFPLFGCKEFHSKFEILEVNRHERLTDRFVKHFYELNKLPSFENIGSLREFWLTLFNAETEEDLEKLSASEVSVMSQAVAAYRQVSISPEFKEYERIRAKARHDEAQAMHNAEQRGAAKERQKWQGVADENTQLRNVVADKDALIEELLEQLGRNQQ